MLSPQVPSSNVENPQPLAVRAICFVLLLVPSCLLLLIAWRTTSGLKPRLVGAAVFTLMFAIGLIKEKGIWTAATCRFGAMNFLVAIIAMGVAKVEVNDDFWAACIGLITLPAIMMALPAAQALASVQRRARLFVTRLAARSHWPDDLATCSTLPEVKLLHDLLVADAEPALSALNHPRAQVRMIVLSALEGRETWLPGQAERVLHSALYAQEPAVRAAALRAIANVRDPFLIQKVSEFSTDSAPEVRKATFESLLYNPAERWVETRRWIHSALSDRRYIEDGPLPLGTVTLPPVALDDLSVWACEPSAISRRSLASLVQYYRLALQRKRHPELIDRLHNQVLNHKLHSTLRVEIGFLLRDQSAFQPHLLKKMLEQHNPSQIRLLAAGELLTNSFDETALNTLREVAAQPNREIAIGVAEVLQKTMQIDMGLPASGELPAPNSRAAAEVARRVILWTKGKWPENAETDSEMMAYRQTPAASSTAMVKRPMLSSSSHASSMDTPWIE